MYIKYTKVCRQEYGGLDGALLVEFCHLGMKICAWLGLLALECPGCEVPGHPHRNRLPSFLLLHG